MSTSDLYVLNGKSTTHLAEAIDAAERWFRDGYEDNPTIPITADLEAALKTDVEHLREDLSAGREFYCGRFYERITVSELPPPPEPAKP